MIGDYLTQTLQLLRRTGQDAIGAATYAAGVNVRGRVQQRKRMIRNAQGEQVVSDMQVFLPPTLTVTEGDRIAYGGGVYHVMGVTEEYALDMLSHKVAWTGTVGQ